MNERPHRGSVHYVQKPQNERRQLVNGPNIINSRFYGLDMQFRVIRHSELTVAAAKYLGCWGSVNIGITSEKYSDVRFTLVSDESWHQTRVVAEQDHWSRIVLGATG